MSLALVRLLQLASPTLPVGAYTYSQGLEWAVEAGTVKDEGSAERWIGDVLRHAVANFEGPLLAGLQQAWNERDVGRVAALDGWFTASRETAELRAETLQMGHSLTRLLQGFEDLPAGLRVGLAALPEPAFPTAWACAAVGWDIPAEPTVNGYLWSWLENQVMAALKAVPLGQSAGQRILAKLGTELPALAGRALALPEEEWSNFVPGLAMASCRHETQYSRLFRS